VHRGGDVEVREEVQHVLSHEGFGEARGGLGGAAGAAVVGSEGAIAGVGEGGDDVSELVGGLGEAVQEEEGALERGRRGWGTVYVGEAEGSSGGRGCREGGGEVVPRGGMGW